MTIHVGEGLLFGVAGVLGGIILSALLEDEEEKEKAPEGLLGVVDIVKREAQQALAACQSEEERQNVYAQVRISIQELQDVLREKGDAIISVQEKKAAEEKGEDAKAHVENLRQTTETVRTALDEVLNALA